MGKVYKRIFILGLLLILLAMITGGYSLSGMHHQQLLIEKHVKVSRNPGNIGPAASNEDSSDKNSSKIPYARRLFDTLVDGLTEAGIEENLEDTIDVQKSQTQKLELILSAGVVLLLMGLGLILITAIKVVPGCIKKISAFMTTKMQTKRNLQSAIDRLKSAQQTPDNMMEPVEKESKTTNAPEKPLSRLADKQASGYQKALEKSALFNNKAASKTHNSSVSVAENHIKTEKNSQKESSLEDMLKAQFQNIEKQMSEFRVLAHTVQSQNGKEQKHKHQENQEAKTLNQLTEQVAAIRQYAVNQQNRVEKLQDGYDWSIIRNFCMKFIHCIDNIQLTIGRLSEEDQQTQNLEDVRDDLIFALESSGVEQFSPEIDSQYRGMEKTAEAVKEKIHTQDKTKVNHIAQIVRPGYIYRIDENNTRVIRVAQVKLYG